MPPSNGEIREWLKKENPLGFFRKPFLLKDIDPKQWSGHFNYLITIGRKKFILRFKGPEWGETEGIDDEYEILRYVEKYNVGPKVYYRGKNFFGESVLVEEYLSGKLLAALPSAKLTRLIPSVARIIAKINRIPTTNKNLFHRHQLSYAPNKKTWRRRITRILRDRRTKETGLRIRKLLPKAEIMLDSFEPRLKRVLRKRGRTFIFESAHLGHCLVTPKGLRFMNWEKVSDGDPSYTLAVFLASFAGRADFEEIKAVAIRQYLKHNQIPEFAELVRQRLAEREISNLIWVVWAYTQQPKEKRPLRYTGANQRFYKVEKLLRDY